MAKSHMIVLSVEDRPGTVAEAIATLAEAGVNIISAFGWAPQGVLQLVVDDHHKATSVLGAHGIEYAERYAEVAEMDHSPGALHTYLTTLSEAGVNLRSISGFSTEGGAMLVWTEDT